MDLKILAKAESGRHGTKTKGNSAGTGGGTTRTVETATSINHCLHKEDRG